MSTQCVVPGRSDDSFRHQVMSVCRAYVHARLVMPGYLLFCCIYTDAWCVTCCPRREGILEVRLKNGTLYKYAPPGGMRRLFGLKAKNGFGRFAPSALPHYKTPIPE